jgi:TPP-dependent 2-oxoacid decarboxylase
MTAQELSQLGRHGLRPIVFVLNNSGYLSERMLCKDMALGYNDIAGRGTMSSCRTLLAARGGSLRG